MEHTKKLRRSETDRMIAGVCGGLGEYFDIDPLVIRVLFLILLFTGGAGVVLYIALAILMPKEGDDRSPLQGGTPEDLADRFKEMASEVRARHLEHRAARHSHRHNILGLLFLVLGFLFLINQIFPQRIAWNLVAPMMLIALGLILLVRRGPSPHHPHIHPAAEEKKSDSPAEDVVV